MKFRCSICKDKINGKGHNAEPFHRGRCCNFCNVLVVAERMKRIESLILRTQEVLDATLDLEARARGGEYDSVRADPSKRDSLD